MRITAATMVVAAALAFASPALPADTDMSPAQAQEFRTLSLRTPDGLVLVECYCVEIDRVTQTLASLDNPPTGNRALFQWLVQQGVAPDSIRLYVNETEIRKTVSGLPEMTWKKTTVADAVAGGEVPDISGLQIYEAYTKIRSTGSAVLLDEPAIPRTTHPGMLNHTVFVMSSGYLNGYHGIYVDGENLSKDESSYNIVALDPSGQNPPVSKGFNMFKSPDESRMMAEFLNSLPDGTVILVSIKVGPGVFLGGDAIQALQRFGSGVALDPEVLSSHAMIGKKGWSPGTALEDTAVNMGTEIIYFPESLYVNPEEETAAKAPPGGKRVILTGVDPDSTIYIYTKH